MRVLILGTGKSGVAAGKYLEQRASVSYFDDKDCCPLETLDYDMLVVSPGIPRSHPIYRAFLEKNVPIIGEMELGLQLLQKKAVGITGTNGKTTVTMLVEQALLDQGIRAKATGNMGTPLTESVLDTDTDVFVIEMSSFQLETIKTPKLAAGCILNITPDHLDRYDSLDDYALAKAKIANAVLPEGRLYVEEKILKSWKIEHPGLKSFGFTPDCDVSLTNGVIRRFGVDEIEWEMPAYPHDLENFLAAYALVRDMDLRPEEIIKSFRKFKKLPHRIEFVREYRGVSFYDDSKGTNIDAVIKSVNAMKGPVVLICGGVDKGSSYKAWIPHFRGKVTKIVAIGQAKMKIHEELSKEFHVELSDDLKMAVDYANSAANPGDAILLSPGCSSFDMFTGYKQRGEEFKKFVGNL